MEPANSADETNQPDSTENQAPNTDNPGSGEATPEKTTQEGDDSQPPVKEAAPAQPSDPEQDYKKRYIGTAKDLKEKSEKYDQAIKAQSTLVQNNPAYLDELAKTDEGLADEVSKKVYGTGYEAYQSSQKIKEMRETDPESADREERLQNLELKESYRQNETRKSFLESKGINDNKFDADCQKFESQLGVLDKSFVANNYQRALEIAHNLAFPGGFSKEQLDQAKKDAVLSSQTNKSGGAVSTESGGSTPQMTPAAKEFNSKLTSLLQN